MGKVHITQINEKMQKLQKNLSSSPCNWSQYFYYLQNYIHTSTLGLTVEIQSLDSSIF
jgi:hypothetical protein